MKSPQYTKYSELSKLQFDVKSLAQIIKNEFLEDANVSLPKHYNRRFGKLQEGIIIFPKAIVKKLFFDALGRRFFRRYSYGNSGILCVLRDFHNA